MKPTVSDKRGQERSAMKRLICLSVPCMLVGLMIGHSASLQAGTRTDSATALPNFLIIIADDMACEDCGAYGHPHIRTPNIDRLAKEGIRFDQAFLTCSSCSPSRASIMTGRYPHATGAPELHQPLPASQVLLTTPLRRAGYYTMAAGKWHLGNAVKPQFDVVREGGGDGAYGFWLPVLRERDRSRPFFAWLATTDPHRDYATGTLDPSHRESDGVVPPYLPDVPDTRRDLAMYYDEIGRLDQWVGKVREELEAQGVWDNTVVIFLSDNGRPFPRCKTTVFDSGVRTPLIIRLPRNLHAGAVCKALVSSIDLAPTLTAMAGVDPLPTFQGVSMLPLLDNPQAKIRDYVFSEHNWHDYRAFERSVRTERYLLIRNWVTDVPRTPPADAVRSPTFQAMRRLRDAGQLTPEQMQCFVLPTSEIELYDTQVDFHNLHNLADKPEMREIGDKLQTVLSEWMQRTNDAVPPQLTPDRFDRETGLPISK